MHAQERTLKHCFSAVFHSCYVPLKTEGKIRKLRRYRAPVLHMARTKMEPKEATSLYSLYFLGKVRFGGSKQQGSKAINSEKLEKNVQCCSDYTSLHSPSECPSLEEKANQEGSDRLMTFERRLPITNQYLQKESKSQKQRKIKKVFQIKED